MTGTRGLRPPLLAGGINIFVNQLAPRRCALPGPNTLGPAGLGCPFLRHREAAFELGGNSWALTWPSCDDTHDCRQPAAGRGGVTTGRCVVGVRERGTPKAGSSAAAP
jgi:hypothetical protein